MGSRTPKVDAYIDKAADFATPILTHLREIDRAACPDVEEQGNSQNWKYERRG